MRCTLPRAFVPPYGDQGLAADNLQHVRKALDFILRNRAIPRNCH